MRNYLVRIIQYAVRRDKVRKNIAEHSTLPQGRLGRPSKSLTVAQVQSILNDRTDHYMHPYIVVSLLTGARPEEIRALRREHVHLENSMRFDGTEIPAHINVWRSTRAGGDTKTKKSRRSIALPQLAIEALRRQRARQRVQQHEAGDAWMDSGFVFTTKVGTLRDKDNTLRAFRAGLQHIEGLNAAEWCPTELRHSFTSVMSDAGISIDQISQLLGHSRTTVTEMIYRHQLKPVIQDGARAMDQIFPSPASRLISDAHNRR